MPGGLATDPAILDPGPLAVRGQVHVPSGTNIATVVGLTPGAFDPVTGPVFFGLNVVGPAAPIFMTPTQSTAILNVFTSTLQGVVPASGGGTTNFLRADGTWALPPGGGGGGWDDALAIDNNSGANNPHIDTGQFLGFGVEGSLPASGQIRSSTNLSINVTGFVSVGGSTLATLTSGTAGTTTTFTAGGGAGAGAIISTGGTERLEIETTGAWQVGGVVGTAGQYLRSAGAGAAPAWASLALSEFPSQAADTFLGRLAGAGTPAPQSFTSITSTSILYDATSHTFIRNALSGAIAAAQNSGSTVFSGIQNNGSGTTDRANLNFIGFTVTDDGGNDRINITAPLGVTDGDKGDITVSGSGAVWQVDTDINKTWTGTHQFNGNSFGVNAQTGDVALQALDDILLNASSGLALVAGSGATGFPITTVTPGDIQILADDGIAIDAEGTSGIAINAAGASNFSTSAGNLTLSTTGASTRVVVSGADDVLIESLADAIFVNSTNTTAITAGLNVTAAATGDLLMSAQAGMGFYSGFANAGVASGDLVLNASDGLGLFSGYASAETSVSGGDMTICALSGLQLLAGATPVTNVFTGVRIDSDATIRLATAGTERLEIEATGGWQVGGSVGSTDQVLSSQGAGTPPIWRYPRKTRNRCQWWEDFECVNNTSATGPHHFGQTVWITTALSTGGAVEFLAGEQHHPGIARVRTDATDNSVYSVHRGGPNANSTWIRGDQVLDSEWVVRSNLTQTKAFLIGFCNNTADVTTTGNSDIMAFMFDSDNASLDVNIQCVTRESSGTATVTDSGVSLNSVHGTWVVLRILQTTVGTVQFFIDDVLVATHSTQVPDSELLNCGITVVTRTANQTSIDVDYVYFESQDLTRTA